MQQRRCASLRSCPVTIGACAALILASCAGSPPGFSVAEQGAEGAASRAPSTAGAGEPGGSASPRSPSLDAGASISSLDSLAAPTAIPPSAMTPTSSPAVDAGAQVPDGAAPSSAVPPAMMIRILRVHDVTAGKITAGIVYAHRLEAKRGVIRNSGDALPDAVLTEQAGRENLKVEELMVDVLYAHDIHAGSVEIAKGHVSSVKIDQPAD